MGGGVFKTCRLARRSCIRAVIATVVLPGFSGLLASPQPLAAQDVKRIMVSVGQQMMWAFYDSEVVSSSSVSTGKPGFETPLGTYAIMNKIPSQTMEGVLGGEYYNVPDVPWVMYFTEGGVALHGAYWHSDFGTPVSHGCVNLPMDVAEWLYDWASVGTLVLVVP